MRERRDHLVLGLLLLGQLILLSSRESSRGSVLERTVLAILGPFVHATELGVESVGDFGDYFRLAKTLRTENQRLQEELEAMRRQLVALYGIEEELERLVPRSATPRSGDDFFVASVVYNDRASWLRTLVVFTGSNRSQHNQPVVTAQGLVGRVIVPADRYAKVLLLTDRAAAVSAMIQRTRRRGIAVGGGDRVDRPGLILESIPLQADVRVGDQVVTAGDDGIFPRGIPVGTVRSVEAGAGLVQDIEVDTAIDLGLLDQVYVLTEEVIPEEIRELFYGGALSTP